MERELVMREQIPFTAIQAGAVNGVGVLNAARGVVRMLRGVVDAQRVLGRFKPDVVLLTGGFVGVPVAIAARLRRTPSVVYLPDIEPGMALKLMARFCTKVATTTEDSAAYIDRAKMVVTGYPVRDAFAGLTRDAARDTLDLPRDARVLLVFGGSKGAQSINRAVVTGCAALLAHAHVVQVTGAANWDEVSAAHAALSPELRARWHIYKYLHEEMAAAMVAADLAVCRSGASALGELTYVGLPAVLVPYPYAWRYQKVNADYLVQRGAARRLDDGALAADLVAVVSTMLQDTAMLARMRTAAHALGRRDGAQRIAQVLMECSHD
jgi:UDP-N-acetylglucosamine--N-acetylmuramyl-(pentapeptide) pyrophosphoryl-undecaprenol N-acetylglucosamine transferase